MKPLFQNALLALIGTFLALLLAEGLLSLDMLQVTPLTANGGVDIRELARRSAQSRGRDFDERSLKDVVLQALVSNPRSFPAVSPAYYLAADGGSLVVIDGAPVLPLGIASNAQNYYCNESGVFEKFETDRYGFRNPDRVWDEAVDILAIGDSFTMGSCLPEPESIVGNLRQAHRVLNLGQGANGPLIELASLREFGAVHKPKIVLWNFFPNDLTDDLERDRQNVILNRYLDPSFSQHLVDRNRDVQKAVDGVVADYWNRIRQETSPKQQLNNRSIWSFPYLSSLYKTFRAGLGNGHGGKKKPDIQLFLRILLDASKIASSMDANFLFVYLPDCKDNSYGQKTWKAELLDGIRSMGIDVLDAEPFVAELEGKGGAAFYYCPGSHYSADGAKAIASGIQKKIGANFMEVINR